MLDALRQAASGWVSKVLLGLLVVSFAIWGISGQFFGYGSGTLAEVGDTDVTAIDYQRELQLRFNALAQQGRSIEEARALGVPVQVFGAMVSQAALSDEARVYNLGVSDREVAERIAADPAFGGPDRFDRERFQLVLRNNGLREDDYVRELREEILRRQLVSAVAQGVEAPQALVEALYRYQNEDRAISFLAVDPTRIEPVGEPDPAALQAYFEENRQRFRAPEYRALAMLVLDAAALADPAQVADAEVAEAYQARKAEFTVPERRRIEQIRFETEAELRAALTQLQANPDFRALAAARGLGPADIDLGWKTKAEIIDQNVAAAAFASQPNTISPVFNASLGPTLIHVAEVEPGSVATLEELAPRLREELARGKGRERITELHDAIEDERAAGTTLQEIAAKFSLPYRTVDAVARNGTTPSGERLTDLPGQDALLADAFESDVGVENNPIRLPDEGFVFYEVAEIIPERDRTLEEARADVVAAWRRDEAERRVTERAEALAERLRGGESLETIATEIGAIVEKVENVRRNGDPSGRLSRNAVAQAFAGPEGHVANADGATPDSRILLRVDRVIPPAFFAESEDARRIKALLDQALQSDLQQAYVDHLIQDKGLWVNRAVYDQLVAGQGLQSEAALP